MHHHTSEREQELPEGMIAMLIKTAAEDKTVISLGAGEPDFPAPPAVVSLTRKIAGIASHYSPPEGRHELREAVVKKVRKENKIYCSPDDVVVTNGSQEALMLAAQTTLDVSEQVILPNPCFLGYVPLLELINAFPVMTKLTDKFYPDPDDIERNITKKTKVILLNTPSNPTGAVYPKKLLEQIADIAVDHDLLLFSDEAYEKIIYANARHVSPASLNGMEKHTVTFQTFSKSYAMCGYRVGYMIAPPEITQAVKKVHVYSTISAPTVSQMLAIEALKQNAYTKKMVKEYDRRRRFIVSRLNSMELETRLPEGAFYAFASISTIEKNSRRFALKLLKEKKVAVVPGVEFGPAGEGFIRLSYATDYKKIEAAMGRLEQFVEKY